MTYDVVTASLRLTLSGATVVLRGAIDKAEQIGVPQCVTVVDAGGNLLAFARMDGAKLLSQFSSANKAYTAVSSGVPTGDIVPDNEMKLALATDGRLTNLRGGLPVVVEDQVVGAVGVGSGTGAQDVEVAQAGLDALAAHVSVQ